MASTSSSSAAAAASTAPANTSNPTDSALAAATSAADARVAAEWLARLTTVLEDNPFDREAWHRLARDALNSRHPIGRMRPFWERLTQQFPYHPVFWEIWIGEELKAQNNDYALQLLGKTFLKDFVLSPTLGIFYAQAQMTPNATFDPVQRDKIIKAYEVSLDKTGLDYNAAPLYDAYINFLHKCHASGPYAERQKAESIRRVYVRAVRIPFVGVEKIWNEYCQFEAAQLAPNANSGGLGGGITNVAAAGNNPNDHARDYTTARKAVKKLEQLVKKVRRDLLPMPVRNVPGEREQVGAWRAWIHWERTANALGVPSAADDATRLTERRTLYAASCAIMCMTHFLEPWLQNVSLRERFDTEPTTLTDAVEHARRLLDDAVAICSRGAEILSGVPLLHLVHAELEERRASNPSTNTGSVAEKIVAIYERALSSVKFGATLVYIHYMLSMRRQRGIVKARDVFKQARADARCTIELYLAAALMEYFNAAGRGADEQLQQRQVAQKILDLGITKHQQQQQLKKSSSQAEISSETTNSAGSTIPYDYQRWYVLFQMLVSNDANRMRFAVDRCLASSSRNEQPAAASSTAVSVQQKLQLSSLALLYDQLQGDFDSIQQCHQKRLALALQQQQPQPKPSSSSASNDAAVGGSEINLQPSLMISKWKLFDLMPTRQDDLDVMSYCDLRDDATSSFAPFDVSSFAGPIAPVVFPQTSTLIAPPPQVAAVRHLTASPTPPQVQLPPPPPMIVPDDGYLIPFKPRQYVRRQDDYLTLPGGEFAIVGSLEYLRRQLPPSFQGPFVSVSRLTEAVLAANDRLPPMKPVEYLDSGIDWLAKAARDEIRDERLKHGSVQQQQQVTPKGSKTKPSNAAGDNFVGGGGVVRKRIKTEEDDKSGVVVNGISSSSSSVGNTAVFNDRVKRPSDGELFLSDGVGPQQRDLYSERAKKMLKNT